ncbi:MAG: DUF4386 domain-containing protein, partial [Anaerolineae bacterium]
EFGRFVAVDAPVTLNTIMAHAPQFRIGLVISLFSVVFFLLAAWALYALLRPVNKNLALLFLLFNLGGVIVWCCRTIFLFASLLVFNGADYLRAFQPQQLQAQALLLINLYKTGNVIAQIPYGFWLFPLGYLVGRSGVLPKILGILLIADGFGLLIYVIQFFFMPEFTAMTFISGPLGFIAECGLALWLLIIGVRAHRPIPVNVQKQ